MKRMMVIAALMSVPLGCVSNQGDSSVRFLNVRALKLESDECTATPDRFITGGSLDIALGSNYLMAPSVETNTATPANGTGQGLDVTINELVYSYEVSPAGIKLPADEVDRVPIYAVYRADTNPDESYLFMYAFGPKALKVLQEQVQPGGDPITVLTTIKGQGYLSSGQSVESNEFTFPVTVFASSSVPTCATDESLSGTCGVVGQDGPIHCVKAGP
ncbi:hypothetical protein [Archangium sp.]|uniref:hypothetical protein n=1 Tax=Archangium sp. TaxID=1872627 RepID=UPI00389A2BCB